MCFCYDINIAQYYLCQWYKLISQISLIPFRITAFHQSALCLCLYLLRVRSFFLLLTCLVQFLLWHSVFFLFLHTCQSLWYFFLFIELIDIYGNYSIIFTAFLLILQPYFRLSYNCKTLFHSRKHPHRVLFFCTLLFRPAHLFWLIRCLQIKPLTKYFV